MGSPGARDRRWAHQNAGCFAPPLPEPRDDRALVEELAEVAVESLGGVLF